MRRVFVAEACARRRRARVCERRLAGSHRARGNRLLDRSLRGEGGSPPGMYVTKCSTRPVARVRSQPSFVRCRRSRCRARPPHFLFHSFPRPDQRRDRRERTTRLGPK